LSAIDRLPSAASLYHELIAFCARANFTASCNILLLELQLVLSGTRKAAATLRLTAPRGQGANHKGETLSRWRFHLQLTVMDAPQAIGLARDFGAVRGHDQGLARFPREPQQQP